MRRSRRASRARTRPSSRPGGGRRSRCRRRASSRSPFTWIGSRTLARRWRTGLVQRACLASGMIGMHSPSSNTARPSAPKPMPPISTTCAVEANSATSCPFDERRRHDREVVEMAGAEPRIVGEIDVARPHGLDRVLRSRKCPTDRAIELTWPGVPVTAWASMRPCRSNTPAERSPASRTRSRRRCGSASAPAPRPRRSGGST